MQIPKDNIASDDTFNTQKPTYQEYLPATSSYNTYTSNYQGHTDDTHAHHQNTNFTQSPAPVAPDRVPYLPISEASQHTTSKELIPKTNPNSQSTEFYSSSQPSNKPTISQSLNQLNQDLEIDNFSQNSVATLYDSDDDEILKKLQNEVSENSKIPVTLPSQSNFDSKIQKVEPPMLGQNLSTLKKNANSVVKYRGQPNLGNLGMSNSMHAYFPASGAAGTSSGAGAGFGSNNAQNPSNLQPHPTQTSPWHSNPAHSPQYRDPNDIETCSISSRSTTKSSFSKKSSRKRGSTSNINDLGKDIDLSRCNSLTFTGFGREILQEIDEIQPSQNSSGYDSGRTTYGSSSSSYSRQKHFYNESKRRNLNSSQDYRDSRSRWGSNFSSPNPIKPVTINIDDGTPDRLTSSSQNKKENFNAFYAPDKNPRDMSDSELAGKLANFNLRKAKLIKTIDNHKRDLFELERLVRQKRNELKHDVSGPGFERGKNFKTF